MHEQERVLSGSEIMLLAGTRVALGVGVGLLIAGRFSREERRGAGWALLTVGVLSTIPLVIGVLSKPRLGPRIAERPAA